MHPLHRATRAVCILMGLISSVFAAGSPDAGSNPLLAPSSLPLEYPVFDRIKIEHYEPAYAVAMAEQLALVATIAGNPAEPTFENTVVALERSGRSLARINSIFFNLSGADTNSAMQEIESAMAPRLAAHNDTIYLDAKLFARIASLHKQRDALDLDPESRRVLDRYHKDFVRAGARLPDSEKAGLKALNGEIALLETTFTQNVLREKNASSVLVSDRAELDGLTDQEIAVLADAAVAGGHPGQFEIRLLNTTGQPLLSSLKNRALRERIMAASLARGSRGGEFDNRAVVARLVKLRAERALLLGFPTHAAYQLAEQTAGDVARVNKLLADLAAPAAANARREASEQQAMVDAEKGSFQITAADWDFYSERVRAARYSFDESQLRPYFELNRVLFDGVFYAAHRLYGLSFRERHDLPVYEPDVRVFDVLNEDGSLLSILILDYFARPSKRGGAWMNEYVSQSKLLGQRPVVANHLNIPKPAAGDPVLLTFDEVTTAFHEFGHALHGMFSDVTYPRFSGTSVPRDFVEYPSQVNEMWAFWPEVLANYAKHYQTGAPMPSDLVEKVLATRKFNQGHATTEYLAAALLDQAWHQLAPEQVPAAERVAEFEAAALKSAGLDFAPVPPRYRTTYFSHVFSPDYSAGYYSYIWSEVLDADTVEWFKQNGGLTRANGDRFRSLLLSRGGSAEALDLYRAMIGRDPAIGPLLVRRGLDRAKE